MNIQFVDFIFNQKGTKIDLSHFVSTLINMNDTLVTYNKFTSDNLDATLDVHDTTDAGIRIFTKEIECFVYGIIVSSTDITQIPTFKDNKVELKDIFYYCTNKNCIARNSRQMIHFVNAFEIYEIGPKILDRLKEEGLITDVADLFTLEESDLSGLERFGDKSALNIISSIDKHKKVLFWLVTVFTL